MRSFACIAFGALAACSLYSSNPPPDAACYETAPSNTPVRDPSTGSCQTFASCGCACGDCPPCNGIAVPDWSSCYGQCDSLDESTCNATVGCHPAYLGVDTASQQFWGCWDIAPLTVLEGACTGLDAETCIEHDDCASLYTAASGPQPVAGFTSCEPKSLPPPPAACSTLTTEAACKARPDCEPIYTGSQCTCTPTTCTCQVETFDHCQGS